MSLALLQATKMSRPSADGCAHVGEHVRALGDENNRAMAKQEFERAWSSVRVTG